MNIQIVAKMSSQQPQTIYCPLHKHLVLGGHGFVPNSIFAPKCNGCPMGQPQIEPQPKTQTSQGNEMELD